MASGTRSRVAAQACLLRLPDHCLLTVMQRCAEDASVVLKAGTAHSRLQRAAVEALSSISAGEQYWTWERLQSLLLYLAKQGQHVRSLHIFDPDYRVQLCDLPPSLTKLDSLQLEGVRMQLQPVLAGSPGVLRAGFPLTRLELNNCTLLDGVEGLAAALMQLPDPQHLSVDMHVWTARVFPTDALSHLVQLTCLQLQGLTCCNSSRDSSAALQPLQALTRLADLQLRTACDVTADALSRADQLTRLALIGHALNPRALAGKPQLQHLSLLNCSFVPGADTTQLLSELQHLTQLTRLDVVLTCLVGRYYDGPRPPLTAYASLTASSKLQHLDFSSNTLPLAVWQYMCPPGRTLPHLRYLNLRLVHEADGTQAAPDTSALVRCCPGLQSLITSMPCSTAQLAPLQRLTGLHTLVVGAGGDDDLEGVQTLCQLPGLNELDLSVSQHTEARVLQMTQLTRLTAVMFTGIGVRKELRCDSQDPDSEPVWGQLLRLFVKSCNPEVAQQAAAALEVA